MLAIEGRKTDRESATPVKFYTMIMKLTCPICDREMVNGPAVDRHHFYPKCKGGKETEWVHKICHRKIHSLFTENELAKLYNNAESVKNHPEIIKFIKWVFKKDPDFYDKTITHKRKRR